MCSLRQLIIYATLILTISASHAQGKSTLSGVVIDDQTGETMVGAIVSIKELAVGVGCNAYGYYSITVPKGTYTVEASSLGYQKISMSVDLSQSQRLDIRLKPDTYMIQEVVVTNKAKNENVVSSRVGVEKLEIKEIAKVPVLFGEQDIMKTLTLTPGVKTTGEGSGGMFVRGGSDAQNLVLLDEATVYNTNHLFGFFSTFNSDAIKDLTLYKGTAPAEYGGRISSVMDVKMNDGNNQKYHIGGGIGLISTKLGVEGPIVKNRGSFLVSGRRTYADLFLKLSSKEELNNTRLYFYDLNIKANYAVNDNNKIFLSGYFGRDVIGFKDRVGIDWGNITGTLRWNRIWNEKLFSNTSLIFSDYDYGVKIKSTAVDFKLVSVIKNIHVKHDFQYYLNSRNTLKFGVDAQYYSVTPGRIDATEDSGVRPLKLQDRYAMETALFVSNDWNPGQKWKLNYGLRVSSFNLLGSGKFYTYTDAGELNGMTEYGSGKVVQTYINLEPRLNITYVLGESASVKASYARNTQNLHLIQNSTSSNPTDLWILSSHNVKPEISDQVALGFFKNFNNDQFQLSAEVYYRSLQNQVDLRNGAEISANEYIEGELLFGPGRAYGLEVMLKKKNGRLNGWLSYTLSRAERQIDGINDGNWYAARQDATHDISIVGIYDLSDKWTLSATWVYNTGNAVTFPSGKYLVNGQVEFYYTERNGYRMPDYHRLDLGATVKLKKTRNFESSLSFSLYNAYGRKNAYSIDFIEDPDDSSKTIAEKSYLFTFIPSITYIFKF